MFDDTNLAWNIAGVFVMEMKQFRVDSSCLYTT